MNDSCRPLTEDEFVELGELLASIPDPYQPMSPDIMDGFLVGLLCMKEEIPPLEWMPFIFDDKGNPRARLSDAKAQLRLESLVYRRYRTLDEMLVSGQRLDPIIYPVENERGQECEGVESLLALMPFALGFHETLERWPELKNMDNKWVSSGILGILRHLPDELIGDLQGARNALERESPLKDIEEAIDDLTLSVAEILRETRRIPYLDMVFGDVSSDEKPTRTGRRAQKEKAHQDAPKGHSGSKKTSPKRGSN